MTAPRHLLRTATFAGTVLLVSCATPGKPAGTADDVPPPAAVDQAPAVPVPPPVADDGLRLPEDEFLKMPGQGEFRQSGSPAAGTPAPVIVRPPTEPPPLPKAVQPAGEPAPPAEP